MNIKKNIDCKKKTSVNLESQNLVNITGLEVHEL